MELGNWGAGTLGGEGSNWAAVSIFVVGSVRFAPVKSSRRRSDSALAFDSSPEVLTSSQRTPMPLAAVAAFDSSSSLSINDNSSAAN